MDIDSKILAGEGTSDADGMVEIPIPQDVKKVIIRFYPGTDKELLFEVAFRG